MWRFNININMALPTTGPISLGQIQTEFGGSNPASLSEYYYNGTYVKTTNSGKIPSSGINKFSNYRGAAKGLSNVEYLVVGGGGGGGGSNSSAIGGGGGAGGYLTGTIPLLKTSTMVFVGPGGTINGTGSNSFFGDIIAYGGGKGGDGGWGLGSRGGVQNSPVLSINGGAGGSGGGAGAKGCSAGTTSCSNGSGGAGTSGQGYSGYKSHARYEAILYLMASGGGGASQSGSSGNRGTPCDRMGNYNIILGYGGNGKMWLDGKYYAGGGMGKEFYDTEKYCKLEGSQKGGGLGGGGNAGFAGQANTGGGGGGYANGGSGVVIIRYIGTVAQATGGTITYSGGYVYHTFTSSGTFSI